MRLLTALICAACALALVAGCGNEKNTPARDPADSEAGRDASTLDLLPGDGEIEGWSLVEPGKLYTGEQLYEPINGAADKYFQFRFVEAAFATYRKGEALLDVQVYNMGDSEDAWGIYTTYDDVNVKHMRQEYQNPAFAWDAGIAGESNWELVKRHCFIRLLSVAGSPGRADMAAFRDHIVRRVPDYEGKSAIRSYLPHSGLVAGSIKVFRTAQTLADVFYIADENVFELSKQTLGASACYDTRTTEAGTKVGTNALFVIRYPSDEAATKAFKGALWHFSKAPYTVHGTAEGPEPQLTIQKGDADFMRLGRSRNLLYGAWMIEESERADELFQQLAQSVRPRPQMGEEAR